MASSAVLTLGAFAVDQIQVAEQLPKPSWWVVVKLSEDASKLLRASRKRAEFAVHVEENPLLRGRIFPWHADNQLETEVDSREGALRAAETLNRALLASAATCGREPPEPHPDIITRRPARNLLPAVDLSAPQPHCTADARRAGLKGSKGK